MVYSHGNKSIIFIKGVGEPVTVNHRLEELEELIHVSSAIIYSNKLSE